MPATPIRSDNMLCISVLSFISSFLSGCSGCSTAPIKCIEDAGAIVNVERYPAVSGQEGWDQYNIAVTDVGAVDVMKVIRCASHLEAREFKHLNLSDIQLTDDMWRKLKKCRCRCITLKNTGLNDDRCTLVPVNCVSLDLSNNPITDRGIRELRFDRNAFSLNFSNTSVVGDSIDAFAPINGVLDLSGCPITDRIWGLLFGDVGVDCTTELICDETSVTGLGLAEVKNHSQLCSLSCRHSQFSDSACAALSRFTFLSHVYLDWTPVTDAGVIALCSNNYIAVLTLDGTAITDKCVRDLIGQKKMRELSVRHTGITHEGVAELRLRLPNCVVTADDGT